jgi:oxygen-independent coproporphyrinogen-3 oxidase
VRDWAAAGVTRVSVGVQSLDDHELVAVGRRHDAAAARRALSTVAGAGLSISADLILGLPEQTPESFRASLGQLSRSDAGHVSIYLLETDKSKATEEDRRLHPSRYLCDDAQADLWLETGQTLAREGFSHYEISNWARPGELARHNLKYWKRAPTLGLGVSAHEFWGGRRRANVSALPRYVEQLAAGRRPVAIDAAVSREEGARERLVLGLRLSEGVPASEVEDFIRTCGDPTLAEDYASWRDGRLLEEASGRLRLTERGFLVSNEILCRFV